MEKPDAKTHKVEVKVYPLFERLWHWFQAVLIFILLFTGLDLNGVYNVMDFHQAVVVHTTAALILLALWIFATFWLFTTGTWRHFVPTFDGIMGVIRFYSIGIFKGETHPYKKMVWRKHNPLQVLAYLWVKLMIFPMIWITGILYLTYNIWQEAPNAGMLLAIVANLHILSGYLIGTFIIIHVYMLTMGHSFFKHVAPMVTGYEEIELTSSQEHYLKETEPWRLKENVKED